MPQSFLATTLLPLAISVIMMGLGLTLTLADFRRVLLYPRGVAIGLGNLLLLSPLLGFLIAELFGLSPELAIGLVLLGASPGGTTANLLTHLARGDTALSVSMTAISSVASALTTPLFLSLATLYFMDGQAAPAVDMSRIVLRVLVITLVPLSIGMLIRAALPRQAIRCEPWVKRASVAFLALVILASLYENRHNALAMWLSVGGAALALNLSAMSLSYFISRRARLDTRQATAIAIELGVHNTVLALAVSAMIAPAYMVPAAVYSLVMLCTAGLFVRLMHRRNAVGEAVRSAEAAADSEGVTAR